MNNAAGVANYDERLMQRLYAERASRPADVLVLRDGDEIAQVTQFHARQTTTWNPGRRPQSRTSSSDR